MTIVDSTYEEALTAYYSVDIREHLPVLREYASRCNTVTELGVRWVVSTWAFLAARPKVLRSFDVVHFSHYGKTSEFMQNAAKEINVQFSFYNEDVLLTNNVIETDLLFIDTVHSYKQLKMELKLHGNKAKKYIILHDTVSFGECNEAVIPKNEYWSDELKTYYDSLEDADGINQAIIEFISENTEWKIERALSNNNGLLILSR